MDPDIHLWCTWITVILTGMNGFEKIENLFGVVKTAAIVMFILVAIFLLFKGIGWRTEQGNVVQNYGDFFSEGIKGCGLLYCMHFMLSVELKLWITRY